jgi:hypothetical protein
MTTPVAYTVLSDPDKAPTLALRRKGGGCTLSQGRSHICLSAYELGRLLAWAQAEQQAEVKWTTTTPAKAKMMRYPVTPRSHAPQSAHDVG